MPDDVLQHSHANDAKRKYAKRSGTFTGEAWFEPRVTESPVTVSTVQFMPNARTYWHRHEGGQVLVVIAGRGFVGTRDGVVREVQAGDVIWTPPGVSHYHGARDDSFLMHEAVSVGTTEWLEEVTDAVYGKKA